MEKLSKIGNVEFSAVTNEEISYENEVTDRPVENLDYISDHVKQRPITFTVEGVITGEDAFTKLKTLRKYLAAKQVYKYVGRNIMYNVVIQSLETNHGKNIRNGFSFNMTCKIIKQAKSKIVKIQGVDPVKKANAVSKKTVSTPTKVQTYPVKSKGKIVSAKKTTDTQKIASYKKVETKIINKKSIRNTSAKESIETTLYYLNKKKVTSSITSGKY